MHWHPGPQEPPCFLQLQFLVSHPVLHLQPENVWFTISLALVTFSGVSQILSSFSSLSPVQPYFSKSVQYNPVCKHRVCVFCGMSVLVLSKLVTIVITHLVELVYCVLPASTSPAPICTVPNEVSVPLLTA